MSTADSERPGSVGLDAQADDMALLRRYVDVGSQDAFNQLVARHLSWVHATCRKGLRDRHMAEDAAQAVFIILARRAAAIPPQTRLSGWLFNTARFVIKDAKKQETRYRRRENVAREMSVVRLTPVREPVDAQTQATLDDALATLTERDRLALLMHFYEGLSLAEMADVLGITKDGAKKRVARALSRLRTRMARNGKSAAATVAVLAVLLRSRAVEAAPLGMAQTVSSSATVPGVATSVARWMAQRAMSTSAGASRRLLRALVAIELVTIATMVTVWSVPARKNVAVTSAARTSVAQVQPAAPTPVVTPPPAPAARVVAAAAEPVTPYRTGAFDPEPRVDPLPPFKDEPKPLTQTASAGGGSGLVASSSAAATVGASSITTGASPVRRAVSATPLPLPQAIARAVEQPMPAIAPSASASTGPRTAVAVAAPTSTSTPSSPKPTPVQTPTKPAPEDAFAGGKAHVPPPPFAMRPPDVSEPPPPVAGEMPHPPYEPPAVPPKVEPAKYERHATDYPERGRKVVALALRDDGRDHEFGFGHGPGHIRREFIEETAVRTATRGHKHSTTATEVPRFEPAEIAADTAADEAICPPAMAAAKLTGVSPDPVLTPFDDVATPYVRPFDERRVMAYEASAAAADYAFADPALFSQAVPEPTGVVALAFAAACGCLSRRARRSPSRPRGS